MMTADELGLDPRFAIERELGRGAASHVFEVRDRLQGLHRALKLASRRGMVQRFRGEFRHLSEIRHPNIVRSYDYALTTRRKPYYTMEMVRGVDLGRFGERSDPEILALLAMQILDALATIHARGWVHRDIKPENLLIVGAGPAALVRMIDLGLLHAAGTAASPAGTLPYMAPEVARGEVVDGRADLYSLGVVLYEALLPEDTPGTVEEVARRFSERPPPPNRLNPGIPEGLSDFIIRLVDPDPRGRFGDAEAAADTLARVPGLRIGRGPALAMAERLLRGGAVSHRRRLVARVRRWAATIAAGEHGGICIVGGSIGVGKTPFLREVGMVLTLRGLRVLRLRATNEPGTPIPALLKAARALLPGAPDLPDPGQIPVGADAVAARISAFAGRLARSLARALGDRPTAVIIDDLHRAVPVSIEVLRCLGLELAGAPLVLICAGDRNIDGPPLEEALGPNVEHFALAPLTKTEIARLASHRLLGVTLPEPALERLAHDSQGMPSLVERTLARLIVDKTIQKRGVGYQFVGGRYRAAHHGDAELVAARVAQVPLEQRDLLAAAAVIYHGLNAETLAAVAGVSPSVAAAALADFSRSQILNAGEATEHPTYLFATRSLRAAIYREIPTARRRFFHDRAAGVATAGDRTGRVEERTEHLLRGSDDQKAVQAAIDAGDRAAAVYADRRAIEYYARAYSRLMSPGETRAAAIALRLGVLFERTGELERATVWYEAAITAARGEDIDTEIAATLGLGGVSLIRGLPEQTSRLTQTALQLIGDSARPSLRARTRRLQALVAMRSGDTASAETLLLGALDAFEAANNERQVVEVLLDLASLARQRGEFVAAVRYARRALHRARKLGEPAPIAAAHTVLGRGFLRASRFGGARHALSQALHVARQSGDRLREASVLRELGNLRTRQADFKGALERYNRSLELARAVRSRADEAKCLHNIGVITTLLGRFRGALSALGAALEVATAIGEVHLAAYAHSELGHTYGRLGDLDHARESLHAALEAADSLGDAVLLGEAGSLHAWVELLRGRDNAAHDILGSVIARVDGLEDPADRAMALLYAGRCAAMVGPAASGLAITERLVQEVERGVLKDFEAAALGLHGQVAAHNGDRLTAAASLRTATRLATHQGLRPLEVGLRFELAGLETDDDARAEQLTRAMEITHELVAELPPALAATFLRSAESRALRRDFQSECRRILASA